MNFGPFASWGIKKLLFAYLACAMFLTAGVAQVLHTLVLSPRALTPFTPVSEELYWVPSQAQIALERFNAEVEADIANPADLVKVKTRLGVLRSKLSEMTEPSDVRETLRTIDGFEARRLAFVEFIGKAERLVASGKPADMQELLVTIQNFRDNIISLSVDARQMEVDARINRDHEVMKNRHWLYLAFLSMWGAVLVIGLLALSILASKNKQIAATHEMLEAKKLALDAAVTAEVARNTFLGKVSHEFNSPLQAMLTNIQLLEPRLTDERSHTIIRRLLTSLNQLRVQVSDLLDVAEIKSGKLTLRLSRVNVETLLTDVVGVHQVAADSKGLALKVRVSPMPEVQTDGRRIAQIVTNLVTNAIRHTETGAVTVMAHLGTTKMGGYSIVFTVNDTGLGFPPEVRANLFQPFVQAKRYRGGTGLGLAIVKGLVDQFNGCIELESTVGLGSTFKVEIPVSLNAGESEEWHEDYTPPGALGGPVEQSQPRFQDANSLKKPTILIVEDNPDLLDTLSEYMADRGFAVHTAGSVQSGRAMLSARRYAYIITDMELGDGVGTEIALAAKIGLNAGVPLVCCTAYPKLFDGTGLDIFDVKLAKPVQPDVILEAMLNAASKKTSV